MQLRPVALLLAALALSGSLHAQSSATLTPLDPANRDVQRLAAFGLLDTVIVGQRPYSRLAVARAVQAGQARLEAIRMSDARRAAVAAEVLERLRAEVAPELARLTGQSASPASRLLDRVIGDATGLGGSERRIAEDNGLGGIAASVSPFVGAREGRRLPEGVTGSLETVHELTAGPITLLAHPRVAMLQPRGGADASVVGSLERGYARLVARNVVLQLGRDHVQWGQGSGVGSLLSAGAPALDMVWLGHERPFVLPWLFRYAGPTRLSLLVARLDEGQNFPHPYLVAYKVSALPARWLELGASIYTKGGGRGAPAASFGDRVADAIPLIDVVFKGDDDYQFSDKYAGADLRLRLPALAGLELYGELLVNDLDFNRFGSSVTEDASHVLGAWMPSLDGAGRVDATLELRHTGIRQYRHHQFTSGQVLRGQLLGDPLGPDAQGGYLSLGWSPATWHRFSLDLAAERRSANEYEDVTGGAATIDFEPVLTLPRERRLRAVAGWRGAFGGGGSALLLEGGVERTTHWNSEDLSRTGGLARVGVELRPGRRWAR